MKKKRSVFLQYLLLVSIFLLPTLIYGQTNPDITLSNSLDNDTVCQSTSFTLTVSDTQSDLTTYTLSYGTTQVVSSSTSGLISFTVTGLTSETVLNGCCLQCHWDRYFINYNLCTAIIKFRSNLNDSKLHSLLWRIY